MAEEEKLAQEFKERSVLTLGLDDDSKGSQVADALNERGWSAESRTVSGGNYVLKEDLMFIGTIIFDSEESKKKFEADKDLMALVTKNKINTYTLSLDNAESEVGDPDVDFDDIGKQLDYIGFKQYEEK